MPQQAYVYIMASSFQRLYIGITTEIETRVAKHKNGTYSGSFAARYKIDTAKLSAAVTRACGISACGPAP